MSKESKEFNKIYKVKLVKDGKIDTIHVFNGNVASHDKIIDDFFTEEEKSLIESGEITPLFSKEKINLDDSIATIKIKIMKELQKNISIEEIYLFCQKIEKLNAVAVYQSLTQNGKLPLTKVRLEQFVSNVVSDEDGNPFIFSEDKEIYTFDDIFAMKFEDKKNLMHLELLAFINLNFKFTIYIFVALFEKLIITLSYF
jgi:hypothetical protein